MWNGFKVIDSDAHHHEPMDMWDRYLEPEYRERVPKVIGMQRNFYVYAQDNQLSPVLEAGSPIPAHHDKWMADKYGEAYDRWWSSDIRLKDMDRYGWDIQVILSTNANRVMESAIKNPQVGGAMARAYHNWCHDYASADPARLKFTATLPAGDSKAMVAEARRAVETLGAVSVRNPLLPPGKWLHEPVAARQRSRFSDLCPWRVTPCSGGPVSRAPSRRGTFQRARPRDRFSDG
jgi:uncharacterized protein